MMVIVDLDVGNFANVKKALDGVVSSDPEVIESADKLVLPGVGNFGAVAKKLNPLREAITSSIAVGKPFLGICLGMQLLFSESTEGEGKGLGVLPGKAVDLPSNLSPHIGWNEVNFNEDFGLFGANGESYYFYFVHSYYVSPADKGVVVGETLLDLKGRDFVISAAIRRENVYGVQFHPEKSAGNGLALLKEFKEL